MPGNPDDESILKEERFRYYYRIQLLTIILVNILLALTFFFAVREGALEEIIFAFGNGSLAVMTLIFILLKKRGLDPELRNHVFFIFILITVYILHHLTLPYGYILTGLFFVAFLVSINGKYRVLYLSLLLAGYLQILAYSYWKNPVMTVTLNGGFYAGSFSALLIGYVVTLKSFRFYRRHDRQLDSKVSTVSRQLDEISLLNTQYKLEKERLEKVLDLSEDGIVDINQKENKILMSPRSIEILGFKSNNIDDLDRQFESHLDPEESEEIMGLWADLKSRKLDAMTKEVFYHVNDEKKRLRFYVRNYISLENEAIHHIVIIRDISREYDQSRKIYDSAFSDNLTGLMNRQSLVNFIEENREGYFVSCVAILDIDNFRFFNDSFGYETGDRILRKVGMLLKEKTESYIKAVSCLGGNIFALYLDTVVDESQFFKRLQREIASFSIDDLEIRLNFSLGLAYISDADNSGDGLIKKAEIAMYKAKERGKNGVCVYSEDLKSEMQRHLEIMNEMEEAIVRKEFYLNYQPKVDPDQSKVVGFEALIRWNSPRLGFVPPDEFIRLAEQSGLINALGEFVIEESCRFLQRVRAFYGVMDDFRVSVNVSAVQLLNSGFYESFFRILDEMKIPSSSVGIEITETAVMENKDFVIDQLIRFRERGVHIYLDDFGTGYSSLNYLTMLPIDIMKVDKSFVDRIVQEGREHQVVKMILSLAETFSLLSIAEGVEDEDQLKSLQGMGCRVFQGYFFSKPLAEADALNFIRDFSQKKA